MKPYKIDISSVIYNGILEEVETLEQDNAITFTEQTNRTEFIHDLLFEMIEQFENNCEYYGTYYFNFNFPDSVADKIKWDSEYYQIIVNE